MTNNSRGYFITLEGADGVGKTTQIDLLETYLTSRGISVLKTREPGGTVFGEMLRKVLLESNVDCDQETELLVLFAARSEHIKSIIRPALLAGKWVLCDRFTDATFAYQGGGRGIPFTRIEELEEFVQRGFHPDLTFLLDIPLENAIERTIKRDDVITDRFESLDIGFKKRVKEAYIDRQTTNPKRICLIDANRSIENIQIEIQKYVEPYLY